ncbi:MAG: FeoB-associated Cys-rich membrane protein [Odoribacter sp.]|nr:FeoB-associated Cys-rich membrane protein [Odoribacter sp.]
MQEIIVYVIVGVAFLAALGYLWKRTGKKGKNKCKSCEECPFKKYCS